jgi:glutaredoxin 2
MSNVETMLKQVEFKNRMEKAITKRNTTVQKFEAKMLKTKSVVKRITLSLELNEALATLDNEVSQLVNDIAIFLTA